MTVATARPLSNNCTAALWIFVDGSFGPLAPVEADRTKGCMVPCWANSRAISMFGSHLRAVRSGNPAPGRALNERGAFPACAKSDARSA